MRDVADIQRRPVGQQKLDNRNTPGLPLALAFDPVRKDGLVEIDQEHGSSRLNFPPHVRPSRPLTPSPPSARWGPAAVNARPALAVGRLPPASALPPPAGNHLQEGRSRC